MLYERWRKVAHENKNEIALRDMASGQQWTFSQLAEEVEKLSPPHAGIVFPQGSSVEFVLAVLQGWRFQKIVCPLDAGQVPLSFSEFPKKCVHFKMTSATTGTARVVAFTEEQLAADAENIVATMGLRKEWPNVGVISLAHSYGFSNLILPLLLHGIPLALAAPFPQSVLSASDNFEVITLPAVPALWRAWHEAKAIPINIRLAISAGAPLPLELEKNIFEKSKIKIHNFYGASECGGIAFDSTATPRADAGFVGRPMKNVHLTKNENGFLEVCGGAVGETYWPEADENLKDGCYRSSDLVEIEDGNVFLRGRGSDQINVAGRKISPETIERILQTHSQVRECLVFGMESNDAERADTIVACVVGKSPIQSETLKQFLLGKIPAWQVPREWWFVESLQANQRGKLSRVEWRKKYLAMRNSVRAAS